MLARTRAYTRTEGLSGRFMLVTFAEPNARNVYAAPREIIYWRIDFLRIRRPLALLCSDFNDSFATRAASDYPLFQDWRRNERGKGDERSLVGGRCARIRARLVIRGTGAVFTSSPLIPVRSTSVTRYAGGHSLAEIYGRE